MKHVLTIILFVLVYVPGWSQSDNKLIREGNKKYEQGQYQDAEVDYRKALEENDMSYKGEFNLGDAIYKQENYTESAKVFNEITQKYADDELRAKAFHNLGNSLLEEKKYQESIEAFKNALRLNPSDYDTKYNLAYAKEKLKQQQQQQQNKDDQNKDQKENKDQQQQDQENKQDQQQQQDQQQKEQQEQEQQKQDQQQQQGDEQKQEQNQEKKQQAQPQKISKEDAQRMLQALKNDEKETMKKLLELKAAKTKSAKTEKDW